MIRTDLVHTYPELVTLITSKYLPVTHLENLFVSCQTNLPFLKDFEIYIISQFGILGSNDGGN